MNTAVLARNSASVAKFPDLLPLVGRASELAELEALLEDSDRTISIVFLRGDGGVGKTRLASELAERAARRSWRVATGRAYPVETGVPYALFSDAWLPILRDMDSSTLTVLSRGGEAELGYLFPGLSPSQHDIDGQGSGDPEEFRTRLMWNFTEFVKRHAAREPLLCILEDLQWADESSLQLIHFLARQTSGHPILFVCTYNEQERDRNPQLVQTERSLTSMHVATVHRLEAFNLDQVTELVARTFGVEEESVREFSAVLFGWTRGNAFFVEEILKSLVATGRLRSEGGTWVGWDAKEFGMPGSIRDAVIGRLRGLSKPAQTVAEFAAIVGTRASYPLLESISGLPGPELLNALEELCSHRILDERTESGEVVYHFAHPLVRQILYGEFGLARTRVLHGVVAEAMESYYGPRAIDHADELAFHFARTDGGHLRPKATLYLAAAGRHAFDRRADQEAISYLEAALERAAESSDDAAVRADLVPLLARAHAHVGHFDTAAQLWASALAEVPAGQPGHCALRRTLGMTHFWRGRPDEAHEQLEAGLAAAEAAGDESATVRLLIAKAYCLHEGAGRGAEALEHLQPALRLAEEIGDTRLLARVHGALGALHIWIGPPEKAEEHADRAIELAVQVGDLSVEFWARWGLVVLSSTQGHTEGVREKITQANDLAERARSPVLRLWTTDLELELLYGQGEWDRGIAEGERAISLARPLGQRGLMTRILVWTARFYIARGEHDRAADLVAEAEEMLDLDSGAGRFNVHRVVPCIGLAHCRLGLGDFEGAIEAAQKGLAIAEGTGYFPAVHHLLSVLAEACIWAGDLDGAEAAGHQMSTHAIQINHRLGLVWADACAALVQWKRGDAEGSIAPMREAVEALEAIPMIWHATRLRRELASRYWEVGRAEEAKADLDRVWEVCVRIRAGEEKERARADYRKMGLRAPSESRSEGPLGLTPEELEIAKLVALGMSNKAIAVARHSRERTISTHLSNIYKKLGCGGPGARVKLGNLVREAGLLD